MRRRMKVRRRRPISRGIGRGVERLEGRELMAADVYLSEVVTANSGSLLDEDGESSDWIEVYNAGPDAVNLDDWYLTDDATDLGKWSFPDVVVAPKNSQLVYASGKNRILAGAPLHTNFQLGSEGEYLALARRGTSGLEVVSEFAPTLPQLPDDTSYGVVQTVTTTTVVPGNGSMKYALPSVVGGGLAWTQTNYVDTSWQSGSGGVGYQRSVGGFTVRDVKSTFTIASIADAQALLDGAGIASQKTRITNVVNFLDVEGGGGSGNFDGDLPFPNNTTENDEDFVIRATGTIDIVTPGTYTFGTNSDDGLQLKIADNIVIDDDALHGPEDRFGRIVLPAGKHALELIFFERGGGAEVELFSAPGNFNAFNAQFRLVGDTAAGGLKVETPAVGGTVVGGIGGLVGANVDGLMYGKSNGLYVRVPFTLNDAAARENLSLRLQYDDGVVVYLNGTEIARRNAPASTTGVSLALSDRGESLAVTPELLDLGPYSDLLRVGNNVLAYHLLNDATNSSDALVRSEVVRLQVTAGPLRYFPEPTPGSFNTTPSVAGYLLDEVSFSKPHGFYSSPFELSITAETPGTVIRYTLDGSEPTETNGLVYTAPLNVDRSRIVRARAFLDGMTPSHTETATYVFLGDVITQSANGLPPAGFPTPTVINGQVLDYGMDPDIVNNPKWGNQLAEALTQVPSMSLVMDIDDLLSPTTGIYTHANARGQAWERPGSLELLNPDGTPGFQVDAGVRVRGGFSRSSSNPKHAFRFFFRNEYGAGKLDYPLFGAEGVDEFDGFDLRTTQNYSWAFQGDPTNTFLRDMFARDVQRDMGQPYTRSRYYHLYINGQYWGLYQTQERSEADYAASYFGGDPEDYDVVKSTGSPGGYQNEATDGNMEAYQRLANYFYQAGGLSDSNSADFWKAQGKNPDGTRNPAFERLLDVENLMDYMISNYYQGDRDAPVSRFVPERVNNYFGIINRENPDGFKFFEHDSEHTLDKGAQNLVAMITSSGEEFRYFNPLWMHEQLASSNSQYRLMFADRVYRHLYHGGALSTEHTRALLEGRMAEFDTAMIAESARWGDAKSSTPFTYDHWLTAANTVLNFTSNRADVLIEQFRDQGWYPALNPPEFVVAGTPQHGGQIDTTDPLSFFLQGNVIQTVLLPQESVWSYLDNGSNQGTQWKEVGFNAATWKTGQAELGYGDGDEATVVSFGGNAQSRYITTYFRREVDITNLAQFQTMTLRLRRDDGAVVYVNGKEVARTNLPAGTIGHLTTALTAIGGSDESNFVEFPLTLADFREGRNVIAVEMHQSSGTSSDLSFDLELLGGKFAPPSGNVYYTLDGSDPRAADGSVSSRAIAHTGDFLLNAPTTIAARVRENGVWSPLTSARFVTNSVPARADNLRIIEIHYNPSDAVAAWGDLNVDNDEFEFIELLNTSTSIVDLTDVRLSQGVTFNFAPQSLQPNERLVVVRNREAFASRYGNDVRIAAGSEVVGTAPGEFGGNLSNGGETITLLGANGTVIDSFTYGDTGNWPERADGKGSALERSLPIGDGSLPGSWKSSVAYQGTPGKTPLLATSLSVVVNEVRSSSLAPAVDAIEFFNPSQAVVDVGGWWVSDSSDNLFKYRFPAGASIAAQGYRVLTETDFNPGQGTLPTDFALNSSGDDVWVWRADPVTGEPLAFVDHVDFDASSPGVTLGRFPHATGEDRLVPLLSSSLGSPNLAYRPGDVVVSEVHYHPSDSQSAIPEIAGGEFVELWNATGIGVQLGGWSLSGGVDFDFPAQLTLPAGGTVVIVGFDPANAVASAAFRTLYGMDASAILLGPWSAGDVLDNGGEPLYVRRPIVADPNDVEASLALVEAVRYDDDLGWAVEADGQGRSLARTGSTAFGRSATSWVATLPTPGRVPGSSSPADINGDGSINLADVDQFALSFALGSTKPAWDLNQDGQVNLDDRQTLARTVLGLRPGDADLDGDVDSADLLELVAGWTGALTPGSGQAGWAAGDWDGDLDVDSSDLLQFLENWTGSNAERPSNRIVSRDFLAVQVDEFFRGA